MKIIHYLGILTCLTFKGFCINQTPLEESVSTLNHNTSRKILYVNDTAKKEVEKLPTEFQEEFEEITNLLLADNVQDDELVKKLQGGNNNFWEIRMGKKGNVARSIYTPDDRDFLILHTFKKENNDYVTHIKTSKQRLIERNKKKQEEEKAAKLQRKEEKPIKKKKK